MRLQIPFAYSLKSVLRNRLRSLYALIGVALAVSFVSGSIVAVDSSLFGLVRATIDRVPVDFVFQSAESQQLNISGFASVVSSLKSVEDVADCAFLVWVPGWTFTKGNISLSERNIVFLPENNSKILESFEIVGGVPAAGTVAISEKLSFELGVGVGDDILLEYAGFINLTFPISQIWFHQSIGGQEAPVPSEVELSRISAPLILNITDARGAVGALEGMLGQGASWATYFVWVDRSEAAGGGDIEETLSRVELIRDRIQVKAGSHNLELVDAELLASLVNLSPAFGDLKGLFVGLSLPVMGLGTYLAFVGVELGTRERRQEIGILKARGAMDSQVFGEMIFESIVLGGIAGAAGLLLALSVSRLLLGSSLAYMDPSAMADWAELSVTPAAVTMALVFGIALMLLASYIPLKRAVKIDVAEALHHYVPAEVKIAYNPRWDIVSLSLVALSIVSVLVGSEVIRENVGSALVQTLLLAIQSGGASIIPLVPIFLSVSSIRLLTRGPWRLYLRLASVVRPWTKGLHPLVEKNIGRNPRRSSTLCLVIALTLSFGLFVSVTAESALTYELDQVRGKVGADIRALATASSAYGYQPTLINLTSLREVESLEGVRSTAWYHYFGAEIQTSAGGSIGSSMAVFDAAVYARVVEPEDHWFIDSSSERLKELDRNGTALATRSFAKELGLRVGDTLTVRSFLSTPTDSRFIIDVQLEIAGLVRGLPGLPHNGLFVDRSTMSFISDEQFIMTGGFFGVLIDVEGLADTGEVARRVASVFTEAGLHPVVRIMEIELRDAKRNPGFAALRDFLDVEYAISLAMMTIGVGIIILVTAADRRQELASIVARGSSVSQLRRILLGESITLVVLGLIVGTLSGLLTAYLSNTLPVAVFARADQRFIVSYASLAAVLASLASLLVVSLFAAHRAGKIRVAEVLRIRGG